jgi:hypothetical protein
VGVDSFRLFDGEPTLAVGLQPVAENLFCFMRLQNRVLWMTSTVNAAAIPLFSEQLIVLENNALKYIEKTDPECKCYSEEQKQWVKQDFHKFHL